MLQSLGSQRVGHNLVTEQQQHQQKQVAGCRTSRLCWHSNASSCGWSEVNLLSHVRLFATPWIAAYQASQSMEFFRQEYWSGLPSKGTKPRKSGDGCISWFKTNNMNLCCLHFSLNMCCWKEGRKYNFTYKRGTCLRASLPSPNSGCMFLKVAE